jgi:general stress protein 26
LLSSRLSGRKGWEKAMTAEQVNALRRLVRDIEVAMMTTRRPDGQLVSRPMALQGEAPGADFWFVTSRETEKIDELHADPHVNLGFYKARSREWVSVSGTARLTDEPELIRRLYRPDWRAWFPEDGGLCDGGAGDPRILLIGEIARSAYFLSVEQPQPVVLFEALRSRHHPGAWQERGEVKVVTGWELRREELEREDYRPLAGAGPGRP